MYNRILHIKIVLSLLLMMIITGGWAQMVYHKDYRGNNWDYFNSVIQTSDTGYVFAGYTYSGGAGPTSVLLMKTNRKGDKLFAKTYGGSDSDFGYNVEQTSDGGFIITGFTYSFGSGDADIYLIKTDDQGTLQWSKTYGGTDFDGGFMVHQTLDGGYAIAGYTESFGAGLSDVYIVKTDGAGNMKWGKTYGGSDYDVGYCLAESNTGNLMLAGWTQSYGAGGRDNYLVYTDSTGNLNWSCTYGGANHETANYITKTSAGNFIVTGETQSYGAGNRDVSLFSITAAGNVNWFQTYGWADADQGLCVRETSDGGYIITGSTNNPNSGPFDVFIMKTNGGGTPQWSYAIGDTGTEIGKSVYETFDKGFVVGGVRKKYGQSDWDAHIVKFDDNGYSGCNLTLGNVTSLLFTVNKNYITPSLGNGGTAGTASSVSNNLNIPVSVTCFTCDSKLKASFTANKYTVCIGEMVNFFNGSVGAINYIWLYSGNPIDSSFNFSYTFNTSGAKYISLIAINGQCRDTAVYGITVLKSTTKAGFTESISNKTVTFTNTSLDASSYYWRFGDGDTSVLKDPVHTYNNVGFYVPCLFAISPCDADTFCKSIELVSAIDETGINDLVQVFPNPCLQNLYIHFPADLMNDINLTIQNTIGNKVYELTDGYNLQDSNISSGIKKISIDLSSLPQGVYFVKINSKDRQFVKKVMVLR